MIYAEGPARWRTGVAADLPSIAGGTILAGVLQPQVWLPLCSAYEVFGRHGSTPAHIV